MPKNERVLVPISSFEMVGLLSTLFEQLRQIGWIYEYGEDGRWKGSELACRAVCQFLFASGCSAEGAAPLMAIMKSFRDLQDGIAAPLFSLDQTPRPRERSSERKHYQMFVAAILEVLVKGGNNRKESASRIARAANQWPPFKETDLSGDTVINWRNNFRSLPAEERRNFDRICAAMEAERDSEIFISYVLQNGPPGMPRAQKS